MMTLVQFSEEQERDRWRVVNDGVMGGVSSSRFAITDSGTARFTGTVSLENNGGFASCRRNPEAFDISSGEGFLIRVKGDGQGYKFRARMDDRFVGVAYSWDFETKKGTWLDIRLPFDRCTPTMFGQPVPNAPSFRPADLQQIGFLISDKQAGPFELEIASVQVY